MGTRTFFPFSFPSDLGVFLEDILRDAKRREDGKDEDGVDGDERTVRGIL